MIYTQLNPPKFDCEHVNTQDLGVLDRASLTSVVDFMLKFEEDSTFTPPTKEVMYDTDKYNIDIDSDENVADTFSDLEDYDEVINARAQK